MDPTRRDLVKGALSSALVAGFPGPKVALANPALQKRIPSTGELVPAVGLGSWITFNVGNDVQLKDESTAVINAFFEAGGRMIDCSPMYGSSQPTIGYALEKLNYPKKLFSAEKVWISNPRKGPTQIEKSRKLWGVPRFDLLQVHNLLSWEAHLDTLQQMKANGTLRYIGVTTSHGRQHRLLEKIMRSQKIDFVQLTYNVLDRDVESRLLPLAQERGIAVIANRPFRRGALIRQTEEHPLPPWASETGARSWAEFLLKFIISHQAITCAIPATTRVDHVRENVNASQSILPDRKLRRKMADYVRQL